MSRWSSRCARLAVHSGQPFYGLCLAQEASWPPANCLALALHYLTCLVRVPGRVLQVVPPGAEQVAEGWAAALKGPAQQQVLSTHRKSLA